MSDYEYLDDRLGESNSNSTEKELENEIEMSIGPENSKKNHHKHGELLAGD